MSKLVVIENVSLDGVMQAPGAPEEDTRGGFAHGGWAAPYSDDVALAEMSEGMSAGGPLLFGRRTYESFHGYWGQQADDNPYTPVLNAATKYVVSTTLSEPLPWQNSRLVSEDVPAAVAALKEREQQDVGVLGSGELVQTLIRYDLIDQYVLSIHPLVLGQGARLFRESGPLTKFRLAKSVPTTTGVIIATYDRAR